MVIAIAGVRKRTSKQFNNETAGCIAAYASDWIYFWAVRPISR